MSHIDLRVPSRRPYKEHPGGSNVTTRALSRGRQRHREQLDPPSLAQRRAEGATSHGRGQPPEAGQGREVPETERTLLGAQRDV